MELEISPASGKQNCGYIRIKAFHIDVWFSDLHHCKTQAEAQVFIDKIIATISDDHATADTSINDNLTINPKP